jgi:hypothetical protein
VLALETSVQARAGARKHRSGKTCKGAGSLIPPEITHKSSKISDNHRPSSKIEPKSTKIIEHHGKSSEIPPNIISHSPKAGNCYTMLDRHCGNTAPVDKTRNLCSSVPLRVLCAQNRCSGVPSRLHRLEKGRSGSTSTPLSAPNRCSRKLRSAFAFKKPAPAALRSHLALEIAAPASFFLFHTTCVFKKPAPSALPPGSPADQNS